MDDPLERTIDHTVWQVSESEYGMPPEHHLFNSFDAATDWVRERRNDPGLEFRESNGSYHPVETVHDHGFTIREAPVYDG